MILVDRKKKYLLTKVSLWGTLVFLGLCFSCTRKPSDSNWITLEGNTQGTTFRIQYFDSLNRDFSSSVDSIYSQVNHYFSTYDSTSVISAFNYNLDSSVQLKDNLFGLLWAQTCEVQAQTNGYFDPRVKPLVNFWGFGEQSFTRSGAHVQQAIDSILSFKNKILDDSVILIKQDPRCMIDLNAIAQGYTVDLVSDFFVQKGITRFMVEIGGELRCSGMNAKNTLWLVGIDKPTDTSAERTFQVKLPLSNQALATSGNYRKYYVRDGKKYAHIIDPFTGFPITHQLLSVSVVTSSCAKADAYATALLCMGLEKAILWAEKNQVEVMFLYDENGIVKSYSSALFSKQAI